MTPAILLLCVAQVPPGYGTQPGDLDGGQPFQSALDRCANCHDRRISAPGDPLYMPFDGWASTMMANSVRDPLFQAALTVANQDVPGVGTWCLRCHAPQSYVRGHGVPADGGALDALDREGVTCEVCHRAVAPPDGGAPVIGNAQLTFDPGNIEYGPYGESFSPAHESSDGGLTSSSALCGQCHQVENPLLPWRDPVDGHVLGPAFPLDTTYDEWKQSKYARAGSLQTCQDCHMPPTVGADGGTQWVVGKFASEVRDSPRRHVFAGGNLWGLSAVQANDPTATAALADQFAETKRLTEASLKSAAEVTLTTPEQVAPGENVLVTVRVRNLTGHKLPTGYADGRRIVVQVLLNGRVHTGGFAGAHLIDDGWLRIYEAVHGKFLVGAEEHLAKHDTILKDTRIPPAGFAPPPGAATVPAPASLYANGDGTYADFDQVTWDVDVPDTLQHGETFNVTVRLLYQSTTPAYVDFLRTENATDDRGRNLTDIWRATGEAAPFEMARVERSVPVRVPGQGGAGGGTGSGDAWGRCGCGSGAGAAVGLALLGLLRSRGLRRPPKDFP